MGESIFASIFVSGCSKILNSTFPCDSSGDGLHCILIFRENYSKLSFLLNNKLEYLKKLKVILLLRESACEKMHLHAYFSPTVNELKVNILKTCLKCKNNHFIINFQPESKLI